ncbi:MAG: alpha/beta hydrolase fold protein, partial [Firmicutes bacterium]|nr:alpha/beta hydrolase fold protein [Bacillota bacterium]
ITDNIVLDRENSKHDEAATLFYFNMHGSDWEQVVDNDTRAIIRHQQEIGGFFHKDLQSFKPDILFTGSLQDEFACALAPNYFETVYGELISKIGHGEICLFDTGGHPALLTNQDRFYLLSMKFFA